jgi:hypothetical protein
MNWNNIKDAADVPAGAKIIVNYVQPLQLPDSLAAVPSPAELLQFNPSDSLMALKGYQQERGIAERIPSYGPPSEKALGMHKTAAVGTIILVTNLENNRKVEVRIIGKLPQTDINKDIMLKVSEAAFRALGGVNDQFLIRAEYVK